VATSALEGLRTSVLRQVAEIRAAPWIARRSLNLLRLAGDLGAILFAFALVYQIFAGTGSVAVGSGDYAAIAALFALISLAAFWYLGLYSGRASILNLWELQTTVKGISLAAIVFSSVLFFSEKMHYSRAVILSAILTALVLIVIERRVVTTVARRLRLEGVLGGRIVIYGCGATGQLLMKKIVQASHLGSTVVAFIDDLVPVGTSVCCRITQTGAAVFRSHVVGGFEQLEQVIRRCAATELLVAAPLDPARLRQVLDLCRQAGLWTGVVPRLIDARPDDLVVEELSAIPVLRFRPRRTTAVYRIGKRALDLMIASVALVLTLPLWLVAAALIRLDSDGPVFFVQDRVGQRGHLFRILKFRTMRTNTAPYAHSPVGDDADPRITRVGRLLRMGGFDELPQLINVLRGDMSMVGPRPEMPFIVAGYNDQQRIRLEAKPGITGLWQLSADRHSEIHENIEYDLYYIQHQSLLLDLLILVETVLFTGGVLVQNLRRHSDTVAASADGVGGLVSNLSLPPRAGALQATVPIPHAPDAQDS
jgi:exopolysaccharide biosynthesis polyprenyl glycosylphosphotransferase